MGAEAIREDGGRSKYLEELLGGVPDGVHKRLIEAYKGEYPLKAMESELRKIIMEVLEGEN
jgi:hypothetical protein